MINKAKYKLIQKYGCVQRVYRNVLQVGEGEGCFDTPKQVTDFVKEKKLPVVGNRRIHEVIPDEENLRQYAADNNIDVPDKVPQVALEKIRDAIDKELKKREEEEL